MPKAKKTVSVKALVEYANSLLANPTHPDEYKEAICRMTEKALHLANAYEGYNDLYWMKQGWSEWRAAEEPDFPEKDKYIYGDMGKFSRRYYLPRSYNQEPKIDWNVHR